MLVLVSAAWTEEAVDVDGLGLVLDVHALHALLADHLVAQVVQELLEVYPVVLRKGPDC